MWLQELVEGTAELPLEHGLCRVGLRLTWEPASPAPCLEVPPNGPLPPYRDAKHQVLTQFHREYLGRVLRQTDGNVSLTGQDDGARVEGATSGVIKVRLDRPIDAGPNRPIVCGSVRVGDVPYRVRNLNLTEAV